MRRGLESQYLLRRGDGTFLAGGFAGGGTLPKSIRFLRRGASSLRNEVFEGELNEDPPDDV